MQYYYSRLDIVVHASDIQTQFDSVFCKLWTRAHDSGKFRYRLPKPFVRRIVDCRLKPIVLAVPDRFRLRRSPMAARTLNDPTSGFNFNHVNPEEILLTLTPNELQQQEHGSILIINVSPFAMLHSLFIPQPSQLFNQRLRKSAVTAAVDCFLLSSNKLLCMGFNSLLALASVNHLHFHIWQSPEPVYPMTAIATKKTRVPVYSELPDHPVHNFVLELTHIDNLEEFTASIWRLVEVCHAEEIAYNLLFCRVSNGLMRAVFWPRRSVYGAKPVEPVKDELHMSIAVAELAGMFVVPDEKCASQMNSDDILNAIDAERLSDTIVNQIEEQLALR